MLEATMLKSLREKGAINARISAAECRGVATLR